MAKLFLARHGATSFNEAGIWTGLTDIDMSEKGYEEINQSAEVLAKYVVDLALCSKLVRARSTAAIILKRQANPGIPLVETASLNEKDYGIFTGKNKEDIRAEHGDDTYRQIRRSWDFPIKGGESLQAVHARVVPIHRTLINPVLESGHNVLVASHNNTLRAYIKEIEDLSIEETSSLELGTAEVRVYDFVAGSFQLVAQHCIGEVH